MSYKCECVNAKAYCSRHSKVKMKVMPKKDAAISNTTFYNFFKEQRKTNEQIIAKMLNRLLHKFEHNCNYIIFYDNNTNEEIYRIKL